MEVLRTALTQLRAHILRSLLTMLGIIIGISTVILVVGMIENYRNSIQNDLSKLGANTFQVERNDDEAFRDPDKRRYRKIINRQVAEIIRERCPSVRFVGAELWRRGQSISYKGEKTNLSMMIGGATPEFAVNNGYSLETGRFLTERDIISHTKVTVIGMDAVDKLFPRENPVGRVVRINGQKFTVIGVFEKQGAATIGQGRDNRVIIPITSWEDMWGKKQSANLTIMAKSPELFDQAQDEVIGVLRQERKVAPGEENDFHIFSNASLAETLGGFATNMQLYGSIFGFIALLVAGFGVANVMLVSVTERTKEIGLRKAIGARRKDILRQFLVEAIILCLVGGVIGLVAGLGLVGALGDWPPSVPLWAIIMSMGSTILLGVFAGFYPAYKAANLLPIDALRYE